ncbi:hypothetical protein [Williamsia sp. 1135]|uniref:hypothetical protein n=1 Tax=Williamsia sp. 1135 TaxID=1889262 RepID=UPI001438DD64|nr:hypothetical protein [Williamsia sp. 1135]
MRRCVASVRAHVTLRADSDARPIRLRLGGDHFAMTIAEALDLANQLVDATERTR